MKKRIAKALSWRLIGTIEIFLISYCATGHFGAAGGIAGAQAAISTLLYMAHDKVWELASERGKS